MVNLIQVTNISINVDKNPQKKWGSSHGIQKLEMQYLSAISKNNRMLSVCFQGKPFNITWIQVYAPNNNAEEAEQFYEDLKDLLELTPKRDVLFIIGDWNAEVGSQKTPGITGKFIVEVQNEAGQRLIEFCQENGLVIANILFQQHNKRVYTWTSPFCQYWNQLNYILWSQGWRNSI